MIHRTMLADGLSQENIQRLFLDYVNAERILVLLIVLRCHEDQRPMAKCVKDLFSGCCLILPKSHHWYDHSWLY